MRKTANYGAPKSAKPQPASSATRSNTGARLWNTACPAPNNPLKTPGDLATMNSNHYRALTLRTLVVICLTALLIADSQAQTEAALKNNKDGSGADIVVQGALDSELQPLLAALRSEEHTSELQSLRHLVCR